MFGAPGWPQPGANYLKPERRRIIGTTYHQMESILAAMADQAEPATEPAQAATSPGRPEALAGLPQVQKGEIHSLDLRRGLASADSEHLTEDA